MKILYVLPPNVPRLDLDESHLAVFTVAALLSRQGIEISMLLPGDMEPPDILGVRIYRWSSLPGTDLLRPILRETRPTAVHVENCPWVVPALRYTFQGYLLLNLHSLEPLSGDAISRRNLRMALCLVDQVVLNSFFLKNLFIGRFYGLRLRVNVVYPGVDGSAFLPALPDRGLIRERLKQRLLWAIEPDEPLAFLASAPHDRRGLELMLECSSETPLSRLKFVVAGSAPLVCGTRVIVANSALPKVYRAVDMFVYPTQERMAEGRICLPAMATALPVVASLRGSVPEIVGRAGHYIRQFADASAWGNGLRTVISNSTLCHNMAQSGLLRSRAFTWERTARDLLALYSRGHLSLG